MLADKRDEESLAKGPSREVAHCLSSWLGQYTCVSHSAGANSRGYLVASSGKQYFLKCYPDNDSSDLRIKRESDFIAFIQSSNFANIPQILHLSNQYRCVLFDFITAQTLEQITHAHVSEAIDFIKSINRHNIDRLLDASEAAFSIEDFEVIIDARLKRFLLVDIPDKFITRVSSILESITKYYEGLDKSGLKELDNYELASPSDFGFHNILSTDNGLFFIDFEYAGRDSLWKFICDFFSQPKYSISLNELSTIRRLVPWELLKKNCDTLCYVYQLTLLKWCLIILAEQLKRFDRSSGVNPDAFNPDSLKKLEHGLVLTEAYFNAIPSKYDEMKHYLSV